MFSFFKKEDPLAVRLRSYPGYDMPHAGGMRHLAPAQLQDNLAYLLSQRGPRLEAIGALLMATDGIDILPALHSDAALPGLLDDLRAWAKARWPAVFDAARDRGDLWLRSTRRGDEVVYAMLMDVALLLGELVLRRHAGYRWALDLAPGNAEMRSFRRLVLALPAMGDMPRGLEHDLEALVVQDFRRPEHARGEVLNHWARAVTQIAAGEHERVWMPPGYQPVRPA